MELLRIFSLHLFRENSALITDQHPWILLKTWKIRTRNYIYSRDVASKIIKDPAEETNQPKNQNQSKMMYQISIRRGITQARKRGLTSNRTDM